MRRRILLSLAMWLGLVVTAGLIVLLTSQVVCPALDGVELVRKACGGGEDDRYLTLFVIIAVVFAIVLAVQAARPRSRR